MFAEYRGWEALLALLIHLRWSIILLIALILAWRWEWVGILGFLAFGVWYLIAVQGFGSGVILVMAGVPILVGGYYSWLGGFTGLRFVPVEDVRSSGRPAG